MPTSFGRQPGYGAVRARGITALAAEISTKPSHLSAAIRGRAGPCPEVRERLPELLGVPLDELFTEEALAKPYDPTKNPWVY